MDQIVEMHNTFIEGKTRRF